MSPKQIECDSWERFEDRFDGYHGLRSRARDRYVFRGQKDASWQIKCSLDIFLEEIGHQPVDVDDRNQIADDLIAAFRNNSAGLIFPDGEPKSEHGWEVLARHHGTPSRISDWTRSPYIAAYFAFWENPGPAERVAIWAIDTAKIVRASDPRLSSDQLEFIDSIDELRASGRAVEQRAVAMLSYSPFEDVIDALSHHVWCYSIPVTERQTALSRLYEYGISHRLLFRDLDAAGVAARLSVAEHVEERKSQ